MKGSAGLKDVISYGYTSLVVYEWRMLEWNILHVDFAEIEDQPLRWQVWKEADGPS